MRLVSCRESFPQRPLEYRHRRGRLNRLMSGSVPASSLFSGKAPKQQSAEIEGDFPPGCLERLLDFGGAHSFLLKIVVDGPAQFTEHAVDAAAYRRFVN